MSDQFVGEIRMFAFGFAPVDWAYCDGQELDTMQNDILYCVVSNAFGGESWEKFNLPDLRGRVPMHHGRGVGLGYYGRGWKGGEAISTLTEAQMPLHTHDVKVTKNAATSADATGLYPGKHADTTKGIMYKDNPALDAELHADSVSTTGAAAPHENRQPYQVVPFCIALKGEFPSRSW